MDTYVRLLKLANKSGETFDLTGNPFGTQDNFISWLHEPVGFGMDMDITTLRSIDEDIPTEIIYKFPDITGEIFFNSYKELNRFRDYIMRSQFLEEELYTNENTLRLFYQTVDSESKNYFITILQKIEVSEKDEDTGILKCNVTFKRLSHLKEDVIITLDNSTENLIPYTFPLPTPTSSFIEFGSDYAQDIKFILNNPTNITIPVKFTIIGAYSTPTWVNSNNKLQGGYFLTEQDGILIVDARNIQIITNNGKNAIDSIDHTKHNNFLFLSPGENQITFTVSKSDVVTSLTTVRLEYSLEAPF